METTPIFAQLNTQLVCDNSIEATEIDEIPCDKPLAQLLNQANIQFKFHYIGDFSYLLSLPQTGFIIRSRFCTRDNNASNMNSNITRASNWLGYLFYNVQLRFGGQTIEHIHYSGIVMDTLYHIKNNEFKYQNGELFGCFPDTRSEIVYRIGTRQGNVVGANAVAVIACVNNANQKIFKKMKTIIMDL